MFIILLWLNIPSRHALSPFILDAYEVIYGNLSLNHMYIPMDNETIEEPDTPTDPNFKEDLAVWEDFNFNATIRDHDLMDFNEISRQVNNITRRYTWSHFYGFDDPEDWWTDYSHIEPKKKKMLININVQYLIHTRVHVYRALAVRSMFRGDKRYRLGYLFNRMRRLQYEMGKVYSIAALQNSSDWRYRSLHSLMRLYEQVVRFDVDLRDTAELIKSVNAEVARYDFYYKVPPKTTPSSG